MIPTRPSKRVRKSSAFAKLRGLPRIGQHAVFSDEFFGEEVKDVIDHLETVPLPESHPARRHFGFGQNDADVLDIRFAKNRLEVTLSHYDIRRLACTLMEGQGHWASLRHEFPVTLRFSGVTELLILRRVEQDVYQKIRANQSSVADAVRDVCQMECVGFEPGKQQFVLEIHGRGRGYRRGRKHHAFSYNDDYIFCIEAESLEVDARYRQGWTEHFGGRHLDILDDFESVWPVPGWGMPDFYKWLGQRGRQAPDP